MYMFIVPIKSTTVYHMLVSVLYVKSTLNLGEMCYFIVNGTHQNRTTYFISWKQPNCSGWTEILEYRVTLECGCETMCTLEKVLSTNSTFASLYDVHVPTGLCKANVTAVNMCEETTTVELNFNDGNFMCVQLCICCVHTYTGPATKPHNVHAHVASFPDSPLHMMQMYDL